MLDSNIHQIWKSSEQLMDGNPKELKFRKDEKSNAPTNQFTFIPNEYLNGNGK